ncbi:MAG: class II aldolase/adducin family protein [Candidatus Tectimicrobiota bacterium]
MTTTSPWQVEKQLREEMCRIGRLIYERRFVAATDGNLSARLDADRVLCTPTGVCKGFLEPADLVVVDFDLNVLQGTREASTEILMHLAAYRARPDVQAIVHAHPPTAIAFSVAGRSEALSRAFLPEVVYTLGAIPTARYATPGTPEVPASLEPYWAHCDAILLDRHGSISIGATLWEAYLKLDKVEHAAVVTFKAALLGTPRPLPAKEVEKLALQGAARGYPTRCSACVADDGVCEREVPEEDNGLAVDVEEAIVEEVLRALQKVAKE